MNGQNEIKVRNLRAWVGLLNEEDYRNFWIMLLNKYAVATLEELTEDELDDIQGHIERREI